MKLTERATDFLNEQEYRSDAVKSLDIIENAFSKIGIKATQELIDFQLNYGGLIIYAGLEPICFGILHGEKVRGDFGYPDKIINELIYHAAKDDIPNDHLACADTRYQEYFTIDINGRYYEGWKLVATTFENLIEDLAVFEEIDKLGYKKSTSEYFENVQIDFEKVKDFLNLTNYPGFPQDIIKWGQNSELAVRISNDKIILYSKTEITEEQRNYLRKITNKKEKAVANNGYTTMAVKAQNDKRETKTNFWSKLKSLWS